ncbi:MAG: bifunctional glycosyltransferase family 2 protein/CDP-glycerol:glycerophosphate glycerophosphotransferase [Eubacterium sp.]|nr:bifunctional glycosyltransferase family 2 protein/CDP-glycerol:glycerophosphate glycerophosphotransferase [Eubacterium sp.]
MKEDWDLEPFGAVLRVGWVIKWEKIGELRRIMEMESFEYKVSVIVPVYNVEEYLRDCLDSLLAQTIDHDQMEVLLINDGSTDGSLEICKEYEELFSCFKVFSQVNCGVSSARNCGIRSAKGKYIMFLDGDDFLSRDTLKSVTTFYDKVYNEVDLVTYKMQTYRNNVPSAMHFRYKYLTKTGIYDLNDFPYICQSTINVCIKNLGDKNSFFDTKLMQAEDQQFISSILLQKLKIGYVEEGLYHYVVRENGSVNSYFAFYFWESVITYYYEKMFDLYSEVPHYLQAMILHDFSWKIKKDQLFPYHYNENQFQNALDRIVRLLDKIDYDIILKFPNLDYYHKFFLLKLKQAPVVVYPSQNNICLFINEKLISIEKSITIVITQLKVHDNTLKIFGYLKSPMFSFIEKPILIANINEEDEILKLFESTASRYKSKMKTNIFWGFNFEKSLNEDFKLVFKVKIDNCIYNTTFYFMPLTPIDLKNNMFDFITKHGIIGFCDGYLYYRNANQTERISIVEERNKSVRILQPKLFTYRELKQIKKEKEIWLYYDCKGVIKDNGYYQFIHDIKKHDGVKRYFILNNDESNELFDEEYKKYIVKFGSNKHKQLFINADKIITAYIENVNIYPFTNEEMHYISDLLDFEIIYLQHGILHASTPWKYTPERLQIDKIVVSSYFEIENFIYKYNFRINDIYASGMPRFDYLNQSVTPKNRILFAPSWRSYLIKPQVNGFWEPENEKFVKSDYYKIFNEFLNSIKLEQLLKENNLYLDFKIHPIFNSYLELFDNNNEHINFVRDSIEEEEYIAFITDFSSFVFDFAYLKRPIIYFVPDILQFRAGMCQYRELDLPFEKAFGHLIVDCESAINELRQIINNNFIPDAIFRERMDNFYLPMKNCADELYQYLSTNTMG